MCLLCQSLPCLVVPNNQERESIMLHPDHDSTALSDFEIVKLIGKGACGRVKLVRKCCGADEGKFYAMKTITKQAVIRKGLVDATNAERRIMRSIQHPYIAKLCYAFQTPAKLYLLTEYYAGGNLLDQLRKVKRFSEDRARLYAAETPQDLG